MNKLLTIVVPVYKVEQYINKCLASCIIYKDGIVDEELMNQLEVIIVNDGTPDNSAELSREYTIRYPNTFRQIDKQNGGHGSAWNVGLKEAKGKYLRFLDSDDWLTNLDQLLIRLSRTDADLVFTHLDKILVEENRIESWNLYPCVYEEKQPINELQLYKTYNCFTAFWLCTYKTSLLQEFYPLFAERISYDDGILYVAPLIKAKSFICYDFVLYNYLIGREGQSVDPSVVAKIVKNHIVAVRHYINFYNKEKATESYAQWLIEIQTTKYCLWVWRELSNQSYDAMIGLRELYNISPRHFENNKWVKLYKKVPLPIYYLGYKLYGYLRKKK